MDKRSILVTGAGSGIGAGIAAGLAADGHHLLVTDVAREPAEAVAHAIRDAGGSAEALALDVTSDASVAAALAAASRPVEVLVNNAGFLVGRRKLEEVDMEFWDEVIRINMTTMMLVTRAAVPALVKAGGASIVNVASLAGRKGGHGGSLVYSSTKGAVITWTRALSAELGPQGVRVNCVAPGLILGTRFHNTHTTKEAADETVRGIPLGRPGVFDDVARAVLFLASEYDGFITGATLDVNGGVYCS